MGNLAQQLREEQQQKRIVQKQKKIKNKKKFFSPGEKILGLSFGAMVCFGAVQILSNQASLYELNKNIQDTKVDIQEQTKVNSELSIQVSELSQYERIKAKAQELGLELNDQNVKVVQEQ